jgi:UDP-N-acetylmuramate--alanine ligase
VRAIDAALAAFHGVRRRFEVLLATERVTIVDDYAHHPTAVRATIAAARQYHRGELIVAFQPHRYTRTAFLAREFAAALHDADRIYLAPIYAASEPAIPGVSERSIGEALSAEGAKVAYASGIVDLEQRLFEEAPGGAMLLMLGAGDITDVAARLTERFTEPPRRAAARA